MFRVIIEKFMDGQVSKPKHIEDFWNACYQINVERAWRGDEACLSYDELVSKWNIYLEQRKATERQ